MNLLLNKSGSEIGQEAGGKATGKNGGKNKASKNLKFAMDLNKEMELMFADDDFRIGKPKKQKSKGSKIAK